MYAVAWNPARPDVVATGGADDTAFIWRVGQDAFEETGGAFLQLQGHTDTVASLAFSSDGTLLASGGMDGCVRVWDTSTGECLQTLEGPDDAIEWISWHPRGAVLLAGSADCTVWMWAARSGTWMGTFAGHGGPVTAGSFTPDGKQAVTVSVDGSLRVWDPKKSECVLTVQGYGFHEAGIACLALSSDGSSALTGSEDGTAKITALATGRVGTTLAPEPLKATNDDEDEEMVPGGIEAVAWVGSLPGVAVTGGLDGRLIAWDTAAANARAVCPHPDGITRISVHPTNPIVLTACLDGCVRAWDVRTGACQFVFRGFTAPVQDLALSPSGDMVVAGAEDGTARVFSLTEQQ